MKDLRWSLSSTEYRGKIIALVLFAILLLIEDQIPSAFLATWAHWLMFRWLLTSTSRSFYYWAPFQPLFPKSVAFLGVVMTQVGEKFPPSNAVLLSPLISHK